VIQEQRVPKEKDFCTRGLALGLGSSLFKCPSPKCAHPHTANIPLTLINKVLHTFCKFMKKSAIMSLLINRTSLIKYRVL
jgi:hypothetical protein